MTNIARARHVVRYTAPSGSDRPQRDVNQEDCGRPGDVLTRREADGWSIMIVSRLGINACHRRMMSLLCVVFSPFHVAHL